MATDNIKIGAPTLIAVLVAVLGIELLLGWGLQYVPMSHLVRIGLVRVVETAVLLRLVVRLEGGLGVMGWATGQWGRGLAVGALWSAAFGMTAVLGLVAMRWAGLDALRLLQFPLPGRPTELALLFVVGGLIGPLAEELFFRGVLYTFFRRWGIAAALAGSTMLFVLLHFSALPVTQVVGGLVFALAYEIHRNLMVPIVIHVLGNMALFALSLPMFHG